MAICKNKIFNGFVIVGGLIGLATFIIILTMMQRKNIITDQEKEAAEEVAVDMLEIELKLIDGMYQVDRRPKTFYIDVT